MNPSQLTEIERLCSLVFGGGAGAERDDAQKQILQLQSSTEHINTCKGIFENSTNAYALVVAANSLEVLMTKFWNNLSAEQKLETRNYIFNFMANHTDAENYVIGALSKLLCRVTKLGWFDGTISGELREIVTDTKSFLTMSTNHHLVALKLLQSLVDEMNTPTTGKTLTYHRKTAVSFRDLALFPAFMTAIDTLKEIQSGNINVNGNADLTQKLTNLAMHLTVTCLSFDFIGTNPEESQEDVGTVQVPSSWQPIVQDTAIMELFFSIYSTSAQPSSKLALQALVLLSSTRRSLFVNEKQRTEFLECLMSGIEIIMRTRRGLQEPENYHEFCRLLGRLKTCYQLSELVKIANFQSWLELAGNFTIMSFQSWQHSMNSIHYLLALWGRMVAALPYLRSQDSTGQADMLRNCVQQIVEAYTQTMLDSVDVVVQSDGMVDDPLDDEGSLKEAMDRFPVIARVSYQSIAQHLIGYWEENLQHFMQGVSMQETPQVQQQMKAIEGRLVWLVTLVGSLIGGSNITDIRKNDDQTELLMTDAKLCAYVFTLCGHLSNCYKGNSRKCDARLELAVLAFFRSFRKVYLLDITSSSSTGSTQTTIKSHSLMSLLQMSKGGPGGVESALANNTAAIQAMMGGSDDNRLGDDNDEDANGNGAPKIENVFQALATIGADGLQGLNSAGGAMNFIIDKVCTNIRQWHGDEVVLSDTLAVFVEFVSAYSNSKALLSLEAVNFLVHNHVGNHFPFLGYNSDNKHRVAFYSALSRLVFSSSEDLDNMFDSFIAPNLDILQQLSQLDLTQLREEQARTAIIGAMRDLRGITASAYNKRTYNLLFDALHPGAFVLFKNIAEVWYDDPIVVTALFKFMQEFVYNKGQRIFFEQSSANGILLFREASAIICSYGSRILQVPTKQDVYVEKYKGIRLMLNTLICALGGNYVNFGVFALYNDAALQNSLDVSLQLCLQIPLEDVLTYVKLSRAYFGCIEMFFRNHLEVLSGLDSSIFLRLAKANLDGLQSTDGTVISACTNTIDHVATYLFLNRNRQSKPTVQQIQAHMASDPEIIPQLLQTLFSSLLFNSAINQWPLTRPIFSLILINEQAFSDYQNQLGSTQSAENQAKLQGEFAKLMDGLQRSLEVTARDRFTQRLTIFRINVRQFMNL